MQGLGTYQAVEKCQSVAFLNTEPEKRGFPVPSNSTS
jgi:hypothetical protein